MDLQENNPNIIVYNILNEYIKNKNNYKYFENLYLTDNNHYISIFNLFDNNHEDINNSLISENINNSLISENINNSLINENINSLISENINNSLINENINSLISENINCIENIKDNNNNNDEDAWETAINDDKFYINNKIARIFPVLKKFSNFSKIKIDEDSFSYITIREIAEIISKIICYHLLEHNLNPLKSIIVDYTSGVGGNALSFCKFFKLVYAIELDKLRAEYLENNIEIYGFKNINVINKCAIEFNNEEILNLNPNIIFVDPPWGGSAYKNNENLTLNLGSMQLEDLVIDITKKFSEHYINIVNLNTKQKNNNYNNKFIVLKLPKNYDVEYFYNHIKSNNNFENYYIHLYLYILNKMIIIVCELRYKFY